MSRKILTSFLLFLPCIAGLSQEADLELWFSTNIRYDFKKKFRVYYEMGYRRDENLTRTKTFYFEGGGYYKPWKFLWVGPYYRYYNDFNGSSLSHLTAVMILREEIGRFDLKSRTRYIAELEKGNETNHFLRERLSASYDIPNFKINPFINNEYIFQIQPGKTAIEQIRFDFGLERSIGTHHTIELWYRYSLKMDDNAVNSHIIGIDYIFEF